MTLETEMRNGLAASCSGSGAGSHHGERESSGDAIRHWAAVASTISAMERKNDGKVEPCDNVNGEGKLDGQVGQSNQDAPLGQRPGAEDCMVDPATNGTKQLIGASNFQPEKVENDKVAVIAEENPLIENLSQVDAEDTSPNPLMASSQSSPVNKIGQDEDGPCMVAGEVSTWGGFTYNMETRQSGDGAARVLEAIKSDEAEQRADKVENTKITTVQAENASSKSSDSHFRSIPAESDALVSSLAFVEVLPQLMMYLTKD
ncbi:hypothetical protein MLD38_012851 [Melastoma candidum]|uniref:Uncharacterized protein n=1 Tax=Melastoma candidum TaxID=119954 RepID=A0ACB9R895_9MYRT|nr:hypothetical protein MLD38_012851 [Melastoma candidum]